jgi:hypothetical protein
MPSLTIRDISEDTLRKMRRAAKQQRRSLNSQAVVWLEKSANQWRRGSDLSELLEAIRATRESVYQRHGPGTDSVKLVRAMRQRGTT